MKSVYAILIYRKPDGPLVHCKVLELDGSAGKVPLLTRLRMDLLLLWYRERYSWKKYLVETAGFDSMETLLLKHPEVEPFVSRRK